MEDVSGQEQQNTVSAYRMRAQMTEEASGRESPSDDAIESAAEDVPGKQEPPRAVVAYRVRARAADETAGVLAEQVADDVYGALVAGGYPVRKNAKDGSRTMEINLDVTRKEVSRLAQWRMYEGKARAEVVTGQGEMIGKKSFRAKGKRSLDPEEAEASAAAGLAQQINEWLPTVLPPAKP